MFWYSQGILRTDLCNVRVLVFRALLSKTDTSQTIAVCRILEPVNMKLTIIRNLAASWYTKQPEADITCELPAVKVIQWYIKSSKTLPDLHLNKSFSIFVPEILLLIRYTYACYSQAVSRVFVYPQHGLDPMLLVPVTLWTVKIEYVKILSGFLIMTQNQPSSLQYGVMSSQSEFNG